MLLTITLILMLLGIIGIFIPIIPDLPLLLLAGIIYGYYTEFQILPAYFYIITIVIVVFGYIIEYSSSFIVLKKIKAHKNVMLGAILGALIGLVLFFPIGIIVGPIIGTLLFEYYYTKDMNKAIKTTFYVILGNVGSMFVKVIMGIFVIILFLSYVM